MTEQKGNRDRDRIHVRDHSCISTTITFGLKHLNTMDNLGEMHNNTNSIGWLHWLALAYWNVLVFFHWFHTSPSLKMKHRKAILLLTGHHNLYCFFSEYTPLIKAHKVPWKLRCVYSVGKYSESTTWFLPLFFGVSYLNIKVQVQIFSFGLYFLYNEKFFKNGMVCK